MGTPAQQYDVERFVAGCRNIARAAGALGVASLAAVLGGEVVQGEAFMGSALATLAGWMSFVALAGLLIGVLGLALRTVPELPRAGAVAVGVLAFATVIAAGAAGTLAIVVPALVEHAPGLAVEPPATVPATFILSGLVMGIAGLVVAISLRRHVPSIPRWSTTLLMVGSVVAIVPLPSRFFLQAIAVAAALGTTQQVSLARPERLPVRS